MICSWIAGLWLPLELQNNTTTIRYHFRDFCPKQIKIIAPGMPQNSSSLSDLDFTRRLSLNHRTIQPVQATNVCWCKDRVQLLWWIVWRSVPVKQVPSLSWQYFKKNLQRNMNPHHSTLSSVTSAHYQSRRYTNYNMQHCSLKNGELSDVGFIPAPHAHLVLECSPCSDSHRSWANISDISDLSILSNCCFCPHQDLPDKYSRVPPKPVLTAEAPCNSSRLEARGEVRKLAWLGQGGNREGGTARWSRNAATVSRSVLELLKVTNGCKSHTVVPVFWCWWGC